MSVEQQMMQQLPDSVRNNMKPGVRYTIGAQTMKGWENSLVTGNKNLGHFYWSPVTSMVQASPSKPTGSQSIAAAPAPRREYHYSKPIKGAMPINPSVYLPPERHAVANNLPPVRKTVSTDLSGKLAFKKPKGHRASGDVNGQLISTNTNAKLYADYPTENNNHVNGNLTHQDAYGKLLND